MMKLLQLFLIFIKIGLTGFGGGYAMISMIVSELDRLDITLLQFADLSALDMIVPGPLMINAATYVGYLNAGFWGSVVATVTVALPSFLYVSLVMRFLQKFRKNRFMNDLLAGVKPAAVGLIAAAAMNIAVAVIFPDGQWRKLFSEPVTIAALLPGVIFIATAFVNIKYKFNPILLTLMAGALGALLA